MKNNVTIIVAIAKNGIIGKKNKMPWHIPEELEKFKQLTSSHNVIMGRNTYNSIGKLLPNRNNYIMTSDKNFQITNAHVVNGFGEMMFELLAKPNEQFYVIGGESIFDQFLPLAGKLIISEIDLEVTGDIYFPKINTNNWKLVKEEQIENNQNIKIIQKFYERKYF